MKRIFKMKETGTVLKKQKRPMKNKKKEADNIKSFQRSIEVMNYSPLDYKTGDEWNAYKENADEHFKKIIDATDPDDLCDQICDPQIDSLTIEAKADAASQKQQHQAIIRHHRDIARGEKYAMEQKKEMAKEELDELKESRNVKLSFFSKSILVNILTLVFIVADTIAVYMVLDGNFRKNPALEILLAIVAAIALDVPLAIAGNVLQQYKLGFGRKLFETKTIIIGAVAAFVITFMLVVPIHFVTRNENFKSKSSSKNTVKELIEISEDTENTNSSNEAKALVFAILLACLPAVTSVASFVISYGCADPESEHKQKIKKKAEERIGYEQAIKEAGDIDEYYKSQMQKEEKDYKIFLQMIDAESLILKQDFRIALMKHLGNPEALTTLSESGRILVSKAPKMTTFSGYTQETLA